MSTIDGQSNLALPFPVDANFLNFSMPRSQFLIERMANGSDYGFFSSYGIGTFSEKASLSVTDYCCELEWAL